MKIYLLQRMALINYIYSYIISFLQRYFFQMGQTSFDMYSVQQQLKMWNPDQWKAKQEIDSTKLIVVPTKPQDAIKLLYNLFTLYKPNLQSTINAAISKDFMERWEGYAQSYSREKNKVHLDNMIDQVHAKLQFFKFVYDAPDNLVLLHNFYLKLIALLLISPNDQHLNENITAFRNKIIAMRKALMYSKYTRGGLGLPGQIKYTDQMTKQSFTLRGPSNDVQNQMAQIGQNWKTYLDKLRELKK